jgi:hypothetical protein
MTLPTRTEWEVAAGLAAIAGLGAVGLWLALRKRPTREELEQRRRDFLVQAGRLVDGVLLESCQVEAEDGRTLTLLLFNYRIGGVKYECSQDITNMTEVVDPRRVQLGFPCSVRYQPGNPQNSIVVAEHWSGLREGIPVPPEYDDRDAAKETSELHPDQG